MGHTGRGRGVRPRPGGSPSCFYCVSAEALRLIVSSVAQQRDACQLLPKAERNLNSILQRAPVSLIQGGAIRVSMATSICWEGAKSRDNHVVDQVF